MSPSYRRERTAQKASQSAPNPATSGGARLQPPPAELRLVTRATSALNSCTTMGPGMHMLSPRMGLIQNISDSSLLQMRLRYTCWCLCLDLGYIHEVYVKDSTN